MPFGRSVVGIHRLSTIDYRVHDFVTTLEIRAKNLQLPVSSFLNVDVELHTSHGGGL